MIDYSISNFLTFRTYFKTSCRYDCCSPNFICSEEDPQFHREPNMNGYDPKVKRRCSAIPIRQLILTKLHNLGLVTDVKLDRLREKHLACFVAVVGTKLTVYYYDEKSKIYLLRTMGSPYGDESFRDMFELLAFLKKISLTNRRVKKEFFKLVTSKLQEMSKIVGNKGYFRNLSTELDGFLQKLSVFTFFESQDFYLRLEVALAFKKLESKASFGVVRNKNSKILSVRNEYFLIRDLGNILNHGFDEEMNFQVSEVTREYVDELQLPSSLTVVPSSSLTVVPSSVHHLENVKNIYRYYNSFLTKNYEGFDFCFISTGSAAILSYYLYASETMKANFLDFSPCKLSPGSLNLISKMTQGGLITNLSTLLHFGMPIRPSLDYYDPVKTLMEFDVCSSYPHSFLTNGQPCGQVFRYDCCEPSSWTKRSYSVANLAANTSDINPSVTNPSVTNISEAKPSVNNSSKDVLKVQNDLYNFNGERDATIYLIWTFMQNKEMNIVNVFHSWNSNGQMKIGNYPVDLVILAKPEEEEQDLGGTSRLPNTSQLEPLLCGL